MEVRRLQSSRDLEFLLGRFRIQLIEHRLRPLLHRVAIRPRAAAAVARVRREDSAGGIDVVGVGEVHGAQDGLDHADAHRGDMLRARRHIIYIRVVKLWLELGAVGHLGDPGSEELRNALLLALQRGKGEILLGRHGVLEGDLTFFQVNISTLRRVYL